MMTKTPEGRLAVDPVRTINYAADYLSIHRVTVYDLIRAGKLRAVEVEMPSGNTALRIRHSELERFLSGGA